MSAEIEVIGQILAQPSKLMDCDLLPKDFISEQHQTIYAEILLMQDQKVEIDPISISDRLHEKTGKNWLATIAGIANAAFCYSTFKNQVENVRKDGQVHRITSELVYYAEEIKRSKDIGLAEQLIQELMTAVSGTSNKWSHTLKGSASKALENLEKLHKSGDIPGIPTGLKKLDEAIGGFRPTNLIVIAARPAMGKTAFLINCALAGASVGPIGFISAEQGNEQLSERMFSILGSIDSQRVRTGKLEDDDWDRLRGAALRMRNLNFYINDKPAVNINAVRQQAREWKYKYNIHALYVDYIQRLEPSRRHEKKTYEVGEVVCALKNIARELNIPVIALAQASRDCEKRQDDKRPYMSDIADSAEIEREADEVITIYRDEVYNVDSADKGIAEILVCKARHGKTGKVHVRWEGKFMQFKDLNRNNYDED